MINLKRTPTFVNEEVRKSENKLVRFLKLFIPPFILYSIICVFVFFKNIIEKVRGIRHNKTVEEGEISKEFHRRRFEEHL